MELFDVLGPLAEDNPLISNSGTSSVTSAFYRFVQQVSLRFILKPTIAHAPGETSQTSKQKGPRWDSNLQ